MNIVKCSSCGRAIVWALSPTGARLPVDARAVTVYRLEDEGQQVNAVKVDHEAKIYVSHFLTCPNPPAAKSR